jgi:hypothetical protein
MVLCIVERLGLHSLKYSKNFRDAPKKVILQVAFDAYNINGVKATHIRLPRRYFHSK